MPGNYCRGVWHTPLLDSGFRRNDGNKSRLPVDKFRTFGLEPRVFQFGLSPATPEHTAACYLDSFSSLTAFRAKLKSATSEDETSRDDFSVSLELAMNSCIASSDTTPVSEYSFTISSWIKSRHHRIVNAGFLGQEFHKLALVLLQISIGHQDGFDRADESHRARCGFFAASSPVRLEGF